MRLEVLCEDRTGLVREVLDRLLEHGIDLHGIELDACGRIYLHFPEVEFSEFQHLMPEIRRIEGVSDVKTVPFTPMEREHNEVQTLLRHLPDAVFSIDARARVLVANQAAQEALRRSQEDLQGELLSNFVKGFAFARWLEAEEVLPQSLKLHIGAATYLADLLPVTINDDGVERVVSAVVVLKSLARVGRQFNLLRRKDKNAFASLTARSEVMQQLLKDAQRLAMLDAPVLVQGETGTGKELLARALHQASLRAGQPFLAVNCAALPDDVAESELFGYAEGGSVTHPNAKRGIFEQANGGSVLLDGIGEMSDILQAKLLRFLQDGSFRRIGSEDEIRVDVRVIATTQKSLLDLIKQDRFREDLYYRINVLSLTVPPLRERVADILPLTEMFVMQFAAELQRDVPKLGRALCDFLQRYHWPGNVRQLRNSLYRAISLLEGEELQVAHLALPSDSEEELVLAEQMFEGTLEEAAKRFESTLLRRLYPSYPSTRQLARRLGVSHTAIANKLREYGIGKKAG